MAVHGDQEDTPLFQAREVPGSHSQWRSLPDWLCVALALAAGVTVFLMMGDKEDEHRK